MAALLADISRGGAVTSGLKKVTGAWAGGRAVGGWVGPRLCAWICEGRHLCVVWCVEAAALC